MPGSRRSRRSSAAATRRSRRPGRSCPEASRAAVTGKGRRLGLAEGAGLVRPRDTVACGFAAGEPVGLLDAIGARPDLEDLTILAGLLVHPHAVLGNPAVRVLSGFFGPIERAARAQGARVQYLPVDFHGLERLGLRMRPRVVVAATSPPAWTTARPSSSASAPSRTRWRACSPAARAATSVYIRRWSPMG